MEIRIAYHGRNVCHHLVYNPKHGELIEIDIGESIDKNSELLKILNTDKDMNNKEIRKK